MLGYQFPPQWFTQNWGIGSQTRNPLQKETVENSPQIKLPGEPDSIRVCEVVEKREVVTDTVVHDVVLPFCPGQKRVSTSMCSGTGAMDEDADSFANDCYEAESNRHTAMRLDIQMER